MRVTSGLGAGLFRLCAARLGLCSHLPFPGRLLGLCCLLLFRPRGVLGAPHGFASRRSSVVIRGARGVLPITFPHVRRQGPELRVGDA